jgi:hypothetical protein
MRNRLYLLARDIDLSYIWIVYAEYNTLIINTELRLSFKNILIGAFLFRRSEADLY